MTPAASPMDPAGCRSSGVACAALTDSCARMTRVTAGATARSRLAAVAGHVSGFPRLRYMGSKYRLVPYLAEVFAELGGPTPLGAFSGSGGVCCLLPPTRF